MKKQLFIVLAFVLLFVSVAFAITWSPSTSITGPMGNFIGLAPKALVTITADEAIDDADGSYYRAIRPTADVTIYYTGSPSDTDVLDADTIILVTPTLRLSTSTLCYVF